MTSPFDWDKRTSELGKQFKPRNDRPGKLPPITLPGTPKWKAPENMKDKK